MVVKNKIMLIETKTLSLVTMFLMKISNLLPWKEKACVSVFTTESNIGYAFNVEIKYWF